MAKERLRDAEFPVSLSDRLQFVCRRALPVIEISDEIEPACIRSPLAEHPRTILLLVQAIIEIVIYCTRESSPLGTSYSFPGIQNSAMPCIYCSLEWLEQ